jgi:hypothetical protein
MRLGGGDEVSALLDPALVLPSLNLEPVGAREVARRRGIVMRAKPRRVANPLRLGHYIPEGASEFELVADAEHGVLLRLEARVEEGPFVGTGGLELDPERA